MNPRTQSKDSVEDSVSTSPDPSKKGWLSLSGGREAVGVWGDRSMRKQEGALWEANIGKSTRLWGLEGPLMREDPSASQRDSEKGWPDDPLWNVIERSMGRVTEFSQGFCANTELALGLKY